MSPKAVKRTTPVPRRRFLVTIECDDPGDFEVGDVKDAIITGTGLPGHEFSVEEIAVHGAPKRINSSLTMLTYTTEDAL